MPENTGASATQTGLAGAEAPEPHSRLGPSDGIPSAAWVILTDENIALRFERHEHHIDFKVFSAALTTRYVNDVATPERWELGDCGDSWALDQWADAFWEIDGGVKWDGCINWQTNPECMMHGCGPSHSSSVAAIFDTIYAYAKRHFDLLGDEAPPMPQPVLELPCDSDGNP